MKLDKIESLKIILAERKQPFENTTNGIVIDITIKGLRTIFSLLVTADGVSIIHNKKASLNLPQSPTGLRELSELLTLIAKIDETPSINEIKQASTLSPEKIDKLDEKTYVVMMDTAKDVYHCLLNSSAQYEIARSDHNYIIYKQLD